MKRFLTTFIPALCLVGTFAATDAQAVTYDFDDTNTSIIPGLTGFATNGAQMDGMAVTVDFVGGGSQTSLWADTGADSGGASGTGWSLTESGDTFTGLWTYSGVAINSLMLSGLNALTVFDTTFTGFGTDGSANGTSWNCVTGACGTAFVTYTYQVAVGAADPVGDLWQVVHIDFSDGGIRAFQFQQDTDNDSRALDVPEPGMLLLLGSGLAGLALRSRRRS